MSYSVIDESNENVRTLDTRSIAEDKAAGVKQMVSDPASIHVVKGSYDDYEDYLERHDNAADPETSRQDVPVPTESPEDVIDDDGGIDDLGESLQDDPLELLPSHMIDTIQGEPAINKRGYAMIAERFGVSVQSRIVVFPWDNDDNRAVARATAETEDGKTYTDYASASVGDGDMSDQIIELASTRALKRVTGWATGLGIVSYHELSEEL